MEIAHKGLKGYHYVIGHNFDSGNLYAKSMSEALAKAQKIASEYDDEVTSVTLDFEPTN